MKVGIDTAGALFISMINKIIALKIDPLTLPYSRSRIYLYL